MKHLIKQILKEQTKSVTCECGWSWKLSEGGDDPYVCHKCGKDNSKKYLKESVDNRIVDVLIKMKLPNYGKIEEFLKETGYDEIEIEEIYSNYFKTISGLKLTPSNWMNFYFSPDQLEIVKSKDYPNSVFVKKNGKVMMEQDKKNGYFWFSYNVIWSFFGLYYGMDNQQIRVLLHYWLEETLKLKGYTPIQLMTLHSRISWNRLSN